MRSSSHLAACGMPKPQQQHGRSGSDGTLLPEVLMRIVSYMKNAGMLAQFSHSTRPACASGSEVLKTGVGV